MDNEEKKSAATESSKSEPLNPKYAVIRKEGWGLMIESSASYDKALITLTTAFLGFIFAVIKLSSTSIHCLAFLVLILVCLMISILCSLLSFWFDQLYGDSLISYADKFYNEGIDEYRNKKHWSYFASMFSKIISGVLFFLALILFSIFIFSNIKNEKTLNDNIQTLNQTITTTQVKDS